MGLKFMDKYSYLHFAVGIITYYWGVKLNMGLIIHTIFELSENTETGVNFINNVITFWPGGKPSSDSYLNMFGDTVFFVLGWLSAEMVDNYSESKLEKIDL